MQALRSTLFDIWQFANNNQAGKWLLGIIGLGAFIYVWTKILNLDPIPGTKTGKKMSTELALKGQKRRLVRLAIFTSAANIIVFVSYFWVWKWVPKDAKEFPPEHHLATMWACCLVLSFVIIALLVHFTRQHTRYKNSLAKQ